MVESSGEAVELQGFRSDKGGKQTNAKIAKDTSPPQTHRKQHKLRVVSSSGFFHVQMDNDKSEMASTLEKVGETGRQWYR